MILKLPGPLSLVIVLTRFTPILVHVLIILVIGFYNNKVPFKYCWLRAPVISPHCTYWRSGSMNTYSEVILCEDQIFLNPKTFYSFSISPLRTSSIYRAKILGNALLNFPLGKLTDFLALFFFVLGLDLLQW